MKGRLTLVAALGLLSCGPAVRVTPTAAPPRPLDCHVDWIRREDPIRRAFDDLGELYVGDSGISRDCGSGTIARLIREHACAAGADALVELAVRYPDPDGFSKCYRFRARMIRYRDDAPAAADP